MSTVSRWIIPSYFTDSSHKTAPLTFDLTGYLKLILKNEVWNRKFDYGFSTGLKNTDPNEIKSARIKVFPRFISGYVNEDRIHETIEALCGKLPIHLKIKNFKEWPHYIGFTLIEIEYTAKTKNIPSKNDLANEPIPNYSMGFIEKYHQHLAVLQELASLFLAGLHLSFPTKSFMKKSQDPLNDGFFQITSGKKTYASKVPTNSFMHEILIETNKISNIELNLAGLASIWHHDLWPIKRYLKAVDSDQISMDNLLDLIYALEGLFEKNASSDFIKMMCLINISKTRKDAKKIKSILDTAYRIRNDIAHGERSYDANDYVKLDGIEVLAQKIYWEVKTIVAVMIMKAVSKLISNKGMRNLRFVMDDFVNITFEK